MGGINKVMMMMIYNYISFVFARCRY